MDRIAIISDIHGNLEALKAVLQDIRKKSNFDYDVYVGSFDNILTLVSYDGNNQIVLHSKMIKD